MRHHKTVEVAAGAGTDSENSEARLSARERVGGVLFALLTLTFAVGLMTSCRRQDESPGEAAPRGAPIRGAPIAGAVREPSSQLVAARERLAAAERARKEEVRRKEEARRQAALAKRDETIKAKGEAARRDLAAKPGIVADATIPPGDATDEPATGTVSADGAASKARISKTEAGEAIPLGFDILTSYEFVQQYDMPANKLPKQIPDDIKTYTGSRVAVKGFMMPIDIERGGNVRQFFLMRDLASCCFGGSPKLNEWVLVNVPKGVKVKYIAYEPLIATGVIEIGEKVEYGRVTSLYRLVADSVRTSNP